MGGGRSSRTSWWCSVNQDGGWGDSGGKAWPAARRGQVAVGASYGACGAVMPRGWVAKEAARQIEALAVPLLLPIFFVYSGLNTRVGLLLDPRLLALAAGIIVVASVCKGGACTLGSRLAGASWRESTAIGALMNARGLMELILINIGLEKGLIGPGLFTALVLMTIVTTAAASPLFRLFWRPVGGGAPAELPSDVVPPVKRLIEQ